METVSVESVCVWSKCVRGVSVCVESMCVV